MPYTALLSVAALCAAASVSLAAPDDVPDSVRSFDDLSWVWYPEGDPTAAATPGKRYFRGHLNIPRDRAVRRAWFLGTADDALLVFVNGHEAGDGDDWRLVHRVGLKRYLRPGDNIVAIEAYNQGPGRTAAGLIGKLIVQFRDGEFNVVRIDKTWKASDREAVGWKKLDFDDTNWKMAVEAGFYGDPPWNRCAEMKVPRMIPESFPRFIVPGHQPAMDSLRDLFHLHYARLRPVATMWTAWLISPSAWPGVAKGDEVGRLGQRWARALSTRGFDPDGYVHTHQHFSYTHEQGWPFPVWTQAGADADGRAMAVGWHFHGPRLDSMYAILLQSLEGTAHVGPTAVDGWELTNAESLRVDDDGWHLRATQASPMLASPAGMEFHASNAPFLQLRWKRTPAAKPGTRCHVEWIGEQDEDFSPKRRVSFSPLAGADVEDLQHCMIRMYDHPGWKGRIKRVRLSLAPGERNVTFLIDSFFTVHDTRHPINNSSFVLGAYDYFRWTGDVEFLRKNMDRMRHALRFAQTEFGTHEHDLVNVPWVGHSGRSGLAFDADGNKTVRAGVGIGNNYWDLLPFGGEDLYATSQLYAATLAMAELEEAIADHPDWGIPAKQPPFDRAELRLHAQAMRVKADRRFWNDKTGRFVACIDRDGVGHDYGLTFLNLEAIHYGIASDEHARSIMNWITGKRIVAGDTSTGADIYHWRFAPRATTKRNVEWYSFVWTQPEIIPWGGQVQDGGAVLGFSYHDLTARLRTLGPDNAWQRLREITVWFDEVQAGGGYREYYKDGTRGTLQGGGTAGGLGLDAEFFESVLVPGIMLDGFLGFRPRCQGFELRPQLPKDWPQLRITRVLYRSCLLDITATPTTITIKTTEGSIGPLSAYLPAGRWQVEIVGASGDVVTQKTVTIDADKAIPVSLTKDQTLRFTR